MMQSEAVKTIAMLIIQFFSYSVLGWCMEVVLKYRQFHRFINRGFLVGPYCPIYGSGVVFITVFVGGSIPEYASYILTFSLSFVVCGMLEYFASWFMEKCFHARWWDYSTKPMNLHGRIWIGNLILFGLGGVAIIKWLNPPYFRMLEKLPLKWMYILAAVIVIIMLSDCVLSTVVLFRVKSEIEGVDLDNSEEISKKIHERLRGKSVLVRRLGGAFPNMTVSPQWILKKMREKEEELREAVRVKEEELRENMKATEAAIKENVKVKEEELRQTVKATEEAIKGKKEEVMDTIKGKMQ